MMPKSIPGMNIHIVSPLFMYYIHCPMPMYMHIHRVTEVKIDRFKHNEFSASLDGSTCSSGSFGLGFVIFLC